MEDPNFCCRGLDSRCCAFTQTRGAFLDGLSLLFIHLSMWLNIVTLNFHKLYEGATLQNDVKKNAPTTSLVTYYIILGHSDPSTIAA